MSLSKKKKKKMGKSYPFFAAKAAKQQARQINKGGVNKGKVNVLPQTRSKRLPQTRSKRLPQTRSKRLPQTRSKRLPQTFASNAL
jgi:hypothetical protein